LDEQRASKIFRVLNPKAVRGFPAVLTLPLIFAACSGMIQPTVVQNQVAPAQAVAPRAIPGITSGGNLTTNADPTVDQNFFVSDGPFKGLTLDIPKGTFAAAFTITASMPTSTPLWLAFLSDGSALPSLVLSGDQLPLQPFVVSLPTVMSSGLSDADRAALRLSTTATDGSTSWTEHSDLTIAGDVVSFPLKTWGTLALTTTAASQSSTPAGAASPQTPSVSPSALTVTLTTVAPNPTNLSPIPVTVTFSAAVTGFTSANLTVGNGVVTGFTANSTSPASATGALYTFKVVPAGQGVVTVDVAAAVAQDIAGNNNTAATQLSLLYDSVAPTVTLSSSAPAVTNVTPIPMTATFSEPVTTFSAAGLTIGNGTVGNFTGSGTTYTFSVTPAGQGLITIDVAADKFHDAAGNGNTAAPQLSRTFDTVAPTVDVGADVTASFPTSLTPTVSGASTYQWSKLLGPGAIVFGTPTAANTTISADTYGAYVVRLTATDIAGNSAHDELAFNWQAPDRTLSVSALKSTGFHLAWNPVDNRSGATYLIYLSASNNIATAGAAVANGTPYGAGGYNTTTTLNDLTDLTLVGLPLVPSYWVNVVGTDRDGHAVGYAQQSVNLPLQLTQVTPISGAYTFHKAGSAPNYLTTWNGRAYLSMYDPGNGTSLWSTDGTDAGSHMVVAPEPGTAIYATGFYGTAVYGGNLYFIFVGSNGSELWKTDGTALGSTKVYTFAKGVLNLGANDSGVIAIIGGGYATPASDIDVWKSDGTSAGTAYLTTLAAGQDFVRGFVGAGPYVYIATTNQSDLSIVSDQRLWRTDGTTGGTIQLYDFAAVPAWSQISGFASYGSKVVFNGYSAAAGTEPWVSDGTPAGTELLVNATGGSTSSFAQPIGQIAETEYIMVGHQGTACSSLYKTDGTPSGTQLVADLGQTANLTMIKDSTIYFSLTPCATSSSYFNFWKSDGTTAGTVQIATFTGFVGLGGLWATANDVELYVYNYGSSTASLWHTDGTGAGTTKLFDSTYFDYGTYVMPEIATVGAYTLFLTTNQGDGTDVWVTDESGPDTHRLLSTNYVPDIEKMQRATVGSRLFFTAGSGTNRELWTAESGAAEKLLDFGNNSTYADLRMVPLGSKVFFAGSTPSLPNNLDLWSSDGTTSGTVVVKAIHPGANANVNALVELGGRIYFSADDGTGLKLWQTDGTSAGTVSVPIAAGETAYSNGNSLVKANGKIIFWAGGGVWEYTPGDTGSRSLVSGFNGISSGSDGIFRVDAYGAYAFFDASDPTDGDSIWITDGTVAGTKSAASTGAFGGRAITAIGNDLYLERWPTESSTTWDVYRHDLTTAQETLITSPIGPGLTVNGQVCFAGVNVYSGVDGVWTANDSGADATMISSLDPIVYNYGFSGLDSLGGRMVFSTGATDGARIWASDGTSAGTVAALSPATNDTFRYLQIYGETDHSVFAFGDYNGTVGLYEIGAD